MTTKTYTPPKLAQILGVDDRKVRGWIQRGELAAINVADNARGQRPRWRIPQEAVDRFLAVRSCGTAPAPQPTKARRLPPAEKFY